MYFFFLTKQQATMAETQTLMNQTVSYVTLAQYFFILFFDMRTVAVRPDIINHKGGKLNSQFFFFVFFKGVFVYFNLK